MANASKTTDVRFIGPVVGRYTLASRARVDGVQIFALRLQSISCTTLVASAPVTGEIGEHVSAFLQPFGNLHGYVERHIEGGFRISLDGCDEERERLAARIDWFKKHTWTGVIDKRQHPRFIPREPRSAIVLADGRVLPCLITDLSVSGAALSADLDPAAGTPLAVGRAVARVVRKLDVGFAVQFVEPLGSEVAEETVHAPDEWEKAMRAQSARAAAEIATEVEQLEREALATGGTDAPV